MSDRNDVIDALPPSSLPATINTKNLEHYYTNSDTAIETPKNSQVYLVPSADQNSDTELQSNEQPQIGLSDDEVIGL
jgi:hypothetical protein